MIVTHGAGVDILLSAGERLGARPVVGALIVAPHPCSPANPMKLGFPVVVIAPANHPEVSPIEALELTEALGGHFVDAGETERLDSSSGHGPWPEGLMRLGWFLKRLG